MMSTQNQAEHGVIQSSIALLQERFKQLQRVKEMREKKQLLTMFSDYKQKPSSLDSYTYESSNSHKTINNNDNYEDYHNLDDNNNNDDEDDELQIFLPPNYYYSNYNRKPSCNSLPSSSSSILSHHNNQNNYHNLTDISLTLWPSAMSSSSYNNATAAAAAATAAAEHFRRASSMSRPSSCISSAYKFEESHVPDVDTTLHL